MNEPIGVTSATFQIKDKLSKDQKEREENFIIGVRGDKLPPKVTVNKPIELNSNSQGGIAKITRNHLDVKDDDTLLQNIQFKLITKPAFGHIENINGHHHPHEGVTSFSYEDLAFNHLQYVQTIKNRSDNLRDTIDLIVTDGKNEAFANLEIIINNHLPILKSTFTMKVNANTRRILTSNELEILNNKFTDRVKVIITHPPQYGVIEKELNNKTIEPLSINKHIPSLNQTLNLILNFNDQGGSSGGGNIQKEYIIVNEFTMDDINAGLISYYQNKQQRHRQQQQQSIDRFGFIVHNGIDDAFIVNDQKVSNVQVFTIQIEDQLNKPPFLSLNKDETNNRIAPIVVRNNGLNSLQNSVQFITKNELEIVDNQFGNVLYQITEPPKYGVIEFKDNNNLKKTTTSVGSFYQKDLNEKRIIYRLLDWPGGVTPTEDYFLFDVSDLALNRLKDVRFDIKWSIVEFELTEVSVMEGEGRVRVNIKRTGNVDGFSSVVCETTQSAIGDNAALSSRDVNHNFDYVYTSSRIIFNKDESVKGCDVIIQVDDRQEDIKSFYLSLLNPKYSLIGTKSRIKVNILDKQKAVFIEFDQKDKTKTTTTTQIQKSDHFISLPIVRSGDINEDVQVECSLEYNYNGTPPPPLPPTSINLIKIPSGQKYSFCDIELDINDDLNSLKVALINPSKNAAIGANNAIQIEVLNSKQCKTVDYTVSENAGQLVIDIKRRLVEGLSDGLSKSIDIQCSSIKTQQDQFRRVEREQSKSTTLSHAIPFKDFKPLNKVNIFK
jgi:hypothetical protein